MKKALLVIIAVSLVIPFAARSAAKSASNDSATLYRDEYGIPHVFAATLESAAFAIGYAQAEDRLEELLKNYRRANGTMAEVFGPENYRNDLIQRMWRHAEISRERQEYQQRPRRKFLNARTQEYKYAAYMDAWRNKVEYVGNLNYPEEAKRRSVRGNVMLDVAIKEDGSVEGVSILRSSGHKLIDDAAVRIVHLAAPFAAFPSDIRAEHDVLHITRTWKFNDSLTSER